MQNHAKGSFYSLPLLAAFAALVVSVAGVGYSIHCLTAGRGAGDCYEQENPPGEGVPIQHDKWPKPLVALVLSGQMHGYYDPCGCSFPQHGGLTRRYNFIQSLKKKDWNVVGLDMGELPGLKGIHEQNMLKYHLSIQALEAMNYRVVGIGRDEILSPLGEALSQVWDKKHPFPRPLNLSLAETAPGEKYHEHLNVRPYEIIADTTPKIGVINLLGPDLREELKPLEKFLANEAELRKALRKFAEAGVEVGIILTHEYPKVDANKFPKGGLPRLQQMEKLRNDQAVKCATFCAAERKKNPKIPPIKLMMVLTDDQESEPRAFMRPLADGLDTQVIEIGHKGKYVGLLGIYDNGKGGHKLQYEMVQMTPKWQTEKGKEKDNPVTALLEVYNQRLKETKMLDKYLRSLHFSQIPAPGVAGLKATYVGSDRCIDCHAHAGAVWEKTPHFKATHTLEKERNPSGRQYDPECMMCHTTGFKHPGGYNDFVADLAIWPAKPALAPNPKRIAKHDKDLRGVGCESCHGPGSEHVKDKDNKALYPLINPYSPTKEERGLEAKAEAKTITQIEKAKLQQLFERRMLPMAQNLCSKCHDHENDVNWGQPGKDTADKWKKLIHRTPGAAIPPAKEKGIDPAPAVVEPPIVIEIIQDKRK